MRRRRDEGDGWTGWTTLDRMLILRDLRKLDGWPEGGPRVDQGWGLLVISGSDADDGSAAAFCFEVLAVVLLEVGPAGR